MNPHTRAGNPACRNNPRNQAYRPAPKSPALKEPPLAETTLQRLLREAGNERG